MTEDRERDRDIQNIQHVGECWSLQEGDMGPRVTLGVGCLYSLILDSEDCHKRRLSGADWTHRCEERL